jgi:hypothetical protein
VVGLDAAAALDEQIAHGARLLVAEPLAIRGVRETNLRVLQQRPHDRVDNERSLPVLGRARDDHAMLAAVQRRHQFEVLAEVVRRFQRTVA